MRRGLSFALPSAGLIALAWACTNQHNPNLVAGGNDAGSADIDEGADSLATDDLGGPGPDASANPCFYVNESTPSIQLDPVGLCIQQQALTYELQYAYTNGQGVAPGWASTGSYAALSGHDWQDDLGLAGALGAYYCSSEVYGNNHSTAAFNAALNDLGGVLVSELQQTPSPTAGAYDGEIYFRLRWAQAAFEYDNSDDATVLKALADAYGASLVSQTYAVGASGGDGGSPGGRVIGTMNADGSVAYSPAQTIMAAAALLDLANLQINPLDAGPVSPLASTAQQVLAYVLARGRDPVTGLFYQSLVTSGDPGHDAIGPGTPTNDTLLTETQSWVMLGLARAQDLLDALPANGSDGGLETAGGDSGLPAEPVYWIAGNALESAVTAAGLFDGTATPGTPPPSGALLEGLILSGQQLLTDKTTLGNAILLGGFHRVAVGEGSALAYQLGEIRAALTQLDPAHTSLLSIVTDANGNLVQQSYLRAGSQAFGYAVAYAPGGDGAAQGPEPGATSYRSSAVHAAVEGLTQIWHGASEDARCAP
jgi:hypothetical protein